MSESLELGGRRIGIGYPTYIVAEMSANHNQEFDRAVRIIKAAHKAGADAIKLQTFTADTLTLDSDRDCFRVQGTIWDGRTLYDLYREAQTPWEWHAPLKRVADDLGIDFFSAPFDGTAVDFLEGLSVPMYKVASFELVDLALIRRVAQTRKPIIMSTGMATLVEIDEAVDTARRAGNSQIALLKCTSAYPALPEQMNLRGIPFLSNAFNVPVGLSDHTLGMAVPVAAVTLGASIVEKHLTLSRKTGSLDSTFSLEPHEFAAMVEAIRAAERSLGRVGHELTDSERDSQRLRRSLFVVKDLKSGDIFQEEDIRSIRPGDGLPPKYLPVVLGRRAAHDIERGTPLSWELVGGTREVQRD